MIAMLLAGGFLWVVGQILTFPKMRSAIIGVVISIFFGVVSYEVLFDFGLSALFSLLIALLMGGVTFCDVRDSYLKFLAQVPQGITVAGGPALGFFGKFVGLYLLVPFSVVVVDRITNHYQTLLPSLVSIMTGFVVFGGVKLYLFGDRGRERAVFHRGRKLLGFEDALTRAETLCAKDDPGIFWGGLRLPSVEAKTHFCVVGATGSGKTITLRLLMQCVLPEIGRMPDRRALIYDAKQDLLSLLSGMNLNCDVITLNPFDLRCAAWDIAADVSDRATAETVASLLISPPVQEAQPYFVEAAQDLLFNVILSFVRNSPRRWALRDVVLGMRHPERMRIILELDSQTSHAVERYFQPLTTFQNVMSTVGQKMRKYETVAGCWHHAEKKVSLEEWARSDYILILGNEEAIRPALDPINRAIFKRASELILHRERGESTGRRTWIIFDEVGKAGRLEGLDDLLTKGRSYGACVVLGLQDIDSLRDAKVYGEKVANVILGQCSNKAILTLHSEQTAKWASGLIGETEAYEFPFTKSTSDSPGGRSEGRSIAEQLVKREAVLSSEFLSLPKPTLANPVMDGYYIVPALDAVYPKRFRFDGMLSPPGTAPNFVARPKEHQYLDPWDAADLQRLGLPLSLLNLKDEPTDLTGFGRME